MSEKKQELVSVESEMALVGDMMMAPDRVVSLACNSFGLEPESFGVPGCSTLVRVVYDMLNDDQVRDVNYLSVLDRLKTMDLLNDVGGDDFLQECIDGVLPGMTESQCDIVRQKWILRQVAGICRKSASDARNAKCGDDLLQEVTARLMTLVGDVIGEESNADALDRAICGYRKAWEIEDYIPGLRTPWRVFDDVANGLEPGMIVIAGRPGQGKTTLEDQIACHVAEHCGPVARITCDMTKQDLLERILCRMSGVSMPKLRGGYVKVGGAQWDDLERNKQMVEDLPIHILEGETDLNAILTWVRMMKRKYDIPMFTLDYIQQIYTGVPAVDAHENVRITKVSSELKKLCVKLGIPGLILSQLSRKSETDGRYPLLSDLRGSGSIEQDANMAIMTYQNMDEDVQAKCGKNCRPQYVDIVKNKNGKTGRLAYWFYAPYFRHEALPGGTDHEDDVRPLYRGNDDGSSKAPERREDGGGEGGEVDVELGFD